MTDPVESPHPSGAAREGRPDPDALLARVSGDEEGATGGRLKIFFGYSAGVGKTYAMLSAARALEMKRGDVLVGYVEPHGRMETESLLLGLDLLPFRMLEYRGIVLREFDLDEALRRHPKLLLVDELAHTNAEGSRHAKRWQDVVELLDAGIDVYTTLNVQHLESLNDVVAAITGVATRETVPDSIFDRAAAIEVVDLPPAELLERFREGKVYLPAQAARAADRFFRTETLVALRELTLRRAAEHVNRQVELGRRGLPTRPLWATRERLMVAVGPSPSSARLVRATRRMATELRAPWLAVSVERPSAGALRREQRRAIDTNLRLAESLGAEVATLHRDDIAEALLQFAHDRGVTRLVIGKSAEPAWRRVLGRDLVDRVLRRSGDLEVLCIGGDAEAEEADADASRNPPGSPADGSSPAARTTLTVVASLALALAAGFVVDALGASETNVVMVFLLAGVVVAYVSGRLASALVAVLAILVFNFFFTEPLHTFVVNDLQYLVTFGVMLVVGLLVSGLVGRVRKQADAAERRADANEILHRVGRRLAATTGRHQIAVELTSVLDDHIKLQVAVFLREAAGLGAGVGEASLVSAADSRAVAEWVLKHNAEAGLGTDTLPKAAAWYLPLSHPRGDALGVVAIRPAQDSPSAPELDQETRRLIGSVAAIAAQALEREELAERARRASIEAEAERLRSDLLETVSHDLRTPLATIGGAASTLLAAHASGLRERERALLSDISAEADRLGGLIENLLQLGRLDDGRAAIRAEWVPAEEIVDAALRQVGRHTSIESVRIEQPKSPVLLYADCGLATQLLVNLLENALTHAEGKEVLVRVVPAPTSVRLEVLDRGPGLGSDPAHLFARFVRGSRRTGRGVGLGLAICRAIALAHGGTIEGRNREGGGAAFEVVFPNPQGAAAPLLQPEAEVLPAHAP